MTNNRLLALLLAGAAAYIGYQGYQVTPTPLVPTPPPPVPSPLPSPPPAKPQPPRRPWGIESRQPVGWVDHEKAYKDALSRAEKAWKEKHERLKAKAQVIGEDEPAVDLLAMPDQLRKRNIAASGLGCCVFRSIEYAGHWQNVPQVWGFPEWMVQQRIPGGGYPTKVDKLVQQISQARNLPVPGYVQYEGRDPAIIELALRTGRIPCITWNANHMLCCVYLDSTRGAILDNNSPGRVQWFSRQQFLSRWTAGGGGWAVILLAPAPPPPPRGTVPQPRCELPRSKPIAPATAKPIYGMDWQPNGSSPKWSICGQVCSEQDAVGALTDDSGFPHLTVIGPDAYRKQVVNDLLGSPHLAQWRDRVRFQDYPADYWALGFGFVTTGQPTIYYQTQDGLVVFRMDKYDGAESLAGALRRSDPSYDPSKDPNGKPSPSLPGLPFDPAKVPTPAYLLAAAAFYLATRKEEK